MSNAAVPVRTLWTAKEVASYLRVSRSWVYHHVEAGDLPHLRFAGHLRFEPDAIAAYSRGERHGADVIAIKGGAHRG